MTYSIKAVLLLLPVLFYSCGDATVDLGSENYEPKIVVEGYLYPGRPVEKIKISRNIPINTQMNRSDLLITDATVSITDETTGDIYPLSYSAEIKAYRYPGSDWIIRRERSYRLQVSATVEGKLLQASSVTHTPPGGFSIRTESSTDTMVYLQRDVHGELMKPQITFTRAPDVDFYAISLIALHADTTTFIYPPVNPYIFSKMQKEKIAENINQFRYSRFFLFNTPKESGEMIQEMEWFHFMFYGVYRVIVYAGDKNMKDYLLTFQRVREVDGNLHEPRFHFEGDGIGVFASAATDTMYMKIKPAN